MLRCFYNITGPTPFPAAYASTDEIADDTPFTGTQHVASFTFQYLNQTSGAVKAVVRFYTVDQIRDVLVPFVATVPVDNLAAGMHQFVTVNLDPSNNLTGPLWQVFTDCIGYGRFCQYPIQRFTIGMV